MEKKKVKDQRGWYKKEKSAIVNGLSKWITIEKHEISEIRGNGPLFLFGRNKQNY